MINLVLYDLGLRGTPSTKGTASKRRRITATNATTGSEVVATIGDISITRGSSNTARRNITKTRDLSTKEESVLPVITGTYFSRYSWPPEEKSDSEEFRQNMPAYFVNKDSGNLATW